MTEPVNRLRFGLYARKSSTGEDRQILSIESQLEVLHELADKDQLNIAKIYQDAGSAHKVDNRPQFNQLLQDLKQGKIDAILCWKFDRLARNMIEGGMVIDALQRHQIKGIITPAKSLFPTDNMLTLAIELGMANQYSLDLSVNVKRGMTTKAKKGGFNFKAPMGYVNDQVNKTVIKDPRNFALVGKLWKMMLTGRYSINALCVIANQDWHFKTQKGNNLRESSLYRTFTNPFYYGGIRCQGELLNNGTHPTMVTQAEFNKVQEIMQQRGHQTNRVASYDFAYRGLLSCATCGCSVTAEKKIKYFCPECRCPQTAKRLHDCRKCGHSFTQKEIDKAHRYTYYRCTKKRGKCPEKALREDRLQGQLIDELSHIEIDPAFADWIIDWMEYLDKNDDKDQETVLSSLSRQIKKLEQRKQGLLDLRLADEISKDEFTLQKQKIEPEYAQACTKLYNLKHPIHTWKLSLKKDLKLCLDLTQNLKCVDLEAKKSALSDLGSNLTLKGQQVTVDLSLPFLKLRQLKKGLGDRLEPLPRPPIVPDSELSEAPVFDWLRILREIRTWYMENQ